MRSVAWGRVPSGETGLRCVMPPACRTSAIPPSFASGFASRRHRPEAKCVNRLALIWRRERDSNQ
jgi:hypothetical protein